MAFISIIMVFVAMAAAVVLVALSLMFAGVVFFGIYLYHRYHGEFKKWAIIISNVFLSLGCVIIALPTFYVVLMPLAMVASDAFGYIFIVICMLALAIFIAGIVNLVLVRTKSRRDRRVGNVRFTAAFIIFYLGLAMCLTCASPLLLFLLGGN